MTRPAARLRGGGIGEYERRFLDGDLMAMRPLLRQAVGANTLTLRTVDLASNITTRANGTGGTRIQFDGMFTALESPFVMSDFAGDYTEIVRAGSLDRTLAANADIQFVLNHDWDAAPMARTTAGTLAVRADGTCTAQLDPARSDVGIVLSAIEGGELDAMSYAFWVTMQEWSPDYTQRDIIECDMDGGDVSVVTHPANPGTTGTISAQSQRAAGNALLRSPALVLLAEHVAAERRAGAALSAATMGVLTQVLNLVADADEAVDAAQPLLAGLMGVPNPDDEDTSSQTNDSGVDPGVVRQRLALANLARKG